MSETHRDPYEVLRIPRDADARTVKAAYFALVREFSPETHPAEFQELRDAYEVLSDPERREQVDASRDAFAELGAEQAALLRAAHEAFAQDDVAGGVAMLRRVIADHPDLLVAREQLGLAFLRTRAFADAAAVWAELVEREPGSARYHLHLGYARQGGELPAKALECYRRALELGGGDEARTALADALAETGAWEEGVKVLDEGIAATREAPPPPLVRKKVALLLLHGQAPRAWRAFNHLVNVVKGQERDRAAHAEELASLAAWLFAQGKQDLANELLRRLGALDPGRKPDRVFPPHAAVHTADLPPESRAWLEGKVERPPRWVVSRHTRIAYLLSIVPGLLLLWGAVYRATSDSPWDGEGIVWTGIVFLVTALALALGGRRFHVALTSPLPRMTLIHPAYYLQLEHDWLHVYPLVNLRDVRLVRHSTNGVYTHTQVHLPFSGSEVAVRFRDSNQATQFAEALLARRRRMLDLLANGLVETEPGIELIPAPILAGGAGRRRRRGRLLAAAAAAAAVACAGAVLLNARLGEARAWSEALAKGTPAAFQAFQVRYPGAGRRLHAALEVRSAQLDEAPEALPAGPGRPRALALVHALATAPTPDLRLSVNVPDGAPAPPGGAVRCRLGPAEWTRALTTGLQAALDRTVGKGLARVGQGAGAVALEVTVTPGPEATYGAEDAPLPPLLAARQAWALRLTAPGAPAAELRGEVPAPASADLPPGGPPAPEAACRALTHAQATGLLRGLSSALGLFPAPEEALP